MIIGAGLGALSSAAMGKSPFTGALMGGALGGLGGAGGLFGAAPTAGVGGLSSVAPAVTAGEIAIPSTSLLEGVVAPSVGIPTSALSGGVTNLGMQGIGSGIVPNAGVQLSSNALAGGLDYGINAGNTLAGGQSIYQAPSFMDNISKFPSQAIDYAKENPTSLLSGANTLSTMSSNAEAQNQQRLNNAVATGAQPIAQKDFDPSSVIAAAPSYGISQNEISRGKVGQIASQARLNDEDVRKIRQFYPSLIG
jgi:hypothetical protein